jgi:hypothetical protein
LQKALAEGKKIVGEDWLDKKLKAQPESQEEASQEKDEDLYEEEEKEPAQKKHKQSKDQQHPQIVSADLE